MPAEAIVVMELKSELDRYQKQYQSIRDGYNQTWRLFNPPITMKLELNGAYLLRYEWSDDKQYKNVKSVEKIERVFVQQAIKELANRSEIVRNFSVATSYAVNMACNDIIEPDKIFEWADKIYEATQAKADKEMNELQNGIKDTQIG